MRKFIIFAASIAALALPTLAVAGNSDAANACKQGGWQNLVRQDGKDFKNQGDCVSYAAKGGIPTTRSIPSATGNVTWDYNRLVTGTVIFNADATGGTLAYKNSNGMWLNGVVTSYRQIDAHTAVFAGTITDGSLDYTDYHPGTDYFFAKVVDGTSGSPDQIAVLANDVPSTDSSGDYDMSQGAGIVTAGDLVVN